MDLSKVKTIHFTGIKGVGMCALALCAQDLGITVSGSDTDEVFPTDQVLKQRKIKPKIGFDQKNFPKNLDLLIYTGAHGGSTNPEVKAARFKNIPCLNLAQGLKLFTQNKQVLAVAGVGGKSTTSAMLATILDSAGLNPSFAIGVGNIFNLSMPSKYQKNSQYFVIEADEYVADPLKDLTPRFHYLDPYLAIITNLEHDHPDVYPQYQDFLNVFKSFIQKVPKDGAVIINIDNLRNQTFIKMLNQPMITYGFSPQADWQIKKTHLANQKQFIKLHYQGIDWPEIILNVPGDYNALNAAAVVAASHQLGISAQKIQTGLKAFKGTKRRFEHIGSVKGIDLFDDYAHHPLELKALFKAIKAWLPNRRLIAIFQSHTFSRTKTLLSQFSKSFLKADIVLINKIFASAREKDNQGMTGRVLTQAIQKYHPNTHYCPGKLETIQFLLDNLVKGDVVFTIGAGNNFLWHQDILKSFKQL